MVNKMQEHVEGLSAAGRLFHQRGWSVGTSSNYSVVLDNDPLRLLITVSGKDKGQLGPQDFVEVDETGTPVPPAGSTEPETRKSSAETLLHVEAARQGNVGAILHTHSVWSTLLSDWFFELGGIQIEGYEMLKGLSGVKTHEHSEWVPIFENTQDIPALAEQVKAERERLGETPIHGYLIRRHGLYTWGENLAEARRHIEIFEFLFECLGRRLGMPAPPAPSASQATATVSG